MTTATIVIIDRADGGMPSGNTAVAGLSDADPFRDSREIVWAGPDRMAAGRVGFSGIVESGGFPHTEIIVVTAGQLSLSGEGEPALRLEPGSGVVVARGTALRLEAAPGTRWAFCAASGDTSAVAGLTSLSAGAALSPSAAPAQELLLSPTPSCRSFNAFTDRTARLRAGTWDSTPYRRVSHPHRVNELMHILAGTVDLTGADGIVTRAGPGDTVFVAHGAPCAWDSVANVAKFYVVQEFGG